MEKEKEESKEWRKT